jgi:hypothetical protein
MASEPANRPTRPASGGRHWTSFVAEEGGPGAVVRALHEAGNSRHRIRVEHDGSTLLVHLSDEDGDGWTTIAVDRKTRQASVAHDRRQRDAARVAYDRLYG